MAAFNNRMSTFSSLSNTTPRPGHGLSHQVSTSTLLNALHNAYIQHEPYCLEASTSLVVNTWATATAVGPDGRYGGSVDLELGRKAWEHARRRAEDGCIVLGSLHESTPSMFAPFISGLPIQVPGTLYTALSVLRAFTYCVTPQNPSCPRHSALAATFSLNLEGAITGATLALSTSGIDTKRGLIDVPAEAGYRAFDVFYYLNSNNASRGERETLGLKPLSEYGLLKKSGTYHPPSYLPTADDAAAAEDFRNHLKSIGIKGASLRKLIMALAALLKLGDTLGFLVDEEVLEQACLDFAKLLDIDPEVLQKKCDTMEREVLVSGLYEAIVDWVVAKANNAIRADLRGLKPSNSADGSNGGYSESATPNIDDDGDSVSITVVEIPGDGLGKAIAMRNVFDDNEGINAEMKQDGVVFESAGSSVLREMKSAVSEFEADMGITTGSAGRELEQERDRREAVLEKVAHEAEPDSFLKDLLLPTGEGVVLGKTGRFDLPTTINSSRVWFQLSVHPTDEKPATLNVNTPAPGWSAGTVSRQLRAWRLPEWANRRNKSLDFTADFDIEEFVERYAPLGCMDGQDGIESWILERGWSNGEVVVGTERVWIREGAWWEAESMRDMKLQEMGSTNVFGGMVGAGGLESGYSVQNPAMGSGFFTQQQYADNITLQGSGENLFTPEQARLSVGPPQSVKARSVAPTTRTGLQALSGGDYGLGYKGDNKHDIQYYGDEEFADGKVVTEQPVSKGRKLWVAATWAFTGWIPSFLLRYVGRMKRPDVRLAWREKLLLVMIICFLNGIVLFYIIAFGNLLCPNFDKAWNPKQVSQHQGEDDFYVSHHGKVYDISKFWKLQHSDRTGYDVTKDNMEPLMGKNLDAYIQPLVGQACPHLTVNSSIGLIQWNDTAATNDAPLAVHKYGPTQMPDPTTALNKEDWYQKKFLPKMKEYYKGALVYDTDTIKKQGDSIDRKWALIENKVYDLTNYFYTQDQNKGTSTWKFLDTKVEDLFNSNPGGDITDDWKNLDTDVQKANFQCIENLFYVGQTDFRKSARCQVNNYILLAFTIILCTVIVVKFLAALQFGSKRRPAAQDKFVICQVPAYTEGEDHLRKGLDSLTATAYDNKRKLICVICDGMIVGGGNDRPTPKIVLDVLGVDPKVDPPALPFRSVGMGNEQLNYGKVYSGLYEYEGNVVPYIVVVKVGKESEQSKSKPGNRGKRDSQILLMNFLNRVHHRAPMSPLELEMFHQINNIIGVDPELYEYLLMVDADTMVKEDALNRLIASCANDSKIIGICGETSLDNEDQSWTTMIQVYEYYISHHLAKAFESLFGSVTCLPGCFCMYRLRTADKGKPLIISDAIIEDYSDCNVDTLHKKNLLSLGEDRYLTTLMMKHFPNMSFKFVPDAYALTAAPEEWSILLSQRRRWINSTIHNLAELVQLKGLCGFCCFSMRIVVFIDLFGTVILPATCGYIAYLIYKVVGQHGAFPMISIIMLAAVYGLQAIIFIARRQWQHVGWMFIYILAFPIYSLALPCYSFWKQDDFSWGNTRVVLGEGGGKKVVAAEEEGFDPRSIPLQRWDDYAAANSLPGRRGAPAGEKGFMQPYEDDVYEMNDMQSQYSSARPASTVLTGFNQRGPVHMPPQSPAPFMGMQQQQQQQRNSGYSDANNAHGRMMSMGGMSDYYGGGSPYGGEQKQARQSVHSLGPFQSQDNLLNSPYNHNPRQRSPLSQSRPVSGMDLRGGINGPSDAAIVEAVQACLAEVDMDTVTKKQLKALAEQRLQTQLSGERRVFLDQMIDHELANM
ncbi:glycosyltransferase family 2 protein [Aplosporella prunicola CBS 121167]|uniref:chitin synthase n=1 Tax=Aplosporella prunicola CBS 121167 TaxID=1176127 RepID=A0A6A6B1N5_9PEZI|nr:glycosyltransferase family 2 protein [Aplosporella prunicola CBS 121167]KAF2137175.1 glycosyltransferase family 2 protein [Aplosporella prunicola CBS 121167]